jgi:glutathione synthase/RimK-type ligase-like ATP-grasp enzyme
MSNDVPVLNKPEDVAIASNKLLTLEKLEGDGVPTIPFTASEGQANDWLSQGHKVYVRHSLTGHSGEGIEVIEAGIIDDIDTISRIQNELEALGMAHIVNEIDRALELRQGELEVELPEAPLYTRGVSNNGEYRVHVFNGEVILYQKKSRRVSEDGEVEVAEGEDADVRNLASNWVYRTGNLRRLERVEKLAIDAVQVLGLDFGAVDIIKDENGDVFVLEINTAPGLGNDVTLEAYVRAFNGEPAQLQEQEV